MHEQPLSVEYEILDTCIKATTWHRTDKIQNYQNYCDILSKAYKSNYYNNMNF